MPHDPRWHSDRPRREREWSDRPRFSPRTQRSGSSDFERFEWRAEDRTPDYFGTGTHFGGGYGTAPGTRTSGAGNTGAIGYGREGAWSDSEDWTPETGRFAAETGVETPSYRGRGPKGYERSDQRLKEIICDRLTDDPRIDASDVSVDVQQRIVRLTGTVSERRTKYAIEDLIERCAGVKDIDNQLRVPAARAGAAVMDVTDSAPSP